MTSPSPTQIAPAYELPATDEQIAQWEQKARLSTDGPFAFRDGRTLALIARIKAEREASDILKAALEPFAKSGRGIGTVYGDEFPIDSVRMGAVIFPLTVGDFRNASRVLLSPQRNEP